MKRLLNCQRGVTLVELLAVVVLLVLVFGSLVGFLLHMYNSYEETHDASDHQRGATTVMTQLEQDVRRSVVPNPVVNRRGDFVIQLQEAGTAYEVLYSNCIERIEGEDVPCICYTKGSGPKLVLADQARVNIETLPDNEYRLTVTVGPDAEPHRQIVRTTTVARYNWGQ